MKGWRTRSLLLGDEMRRSNKMEERRVGDWVDETTFFFSDQEKEGKQGRSEAGTTKEKIV